MSWRRFRAARPHPARRLQFRSAMRKTRRPAVRRAGQIRACWSGQAGAAPWPHFLRWRRSASRQTLPDPLDTWSREVIGAVAQQFGARAVSPSDTPYLPFQQWAMRAEGLKPSPLGILMHPRIRAVARLSRRAAVRREIAIQAPRERDSSLRRMCRKTLPESLSGRAYSVAGFAYKPAWPCARAGRRALPRRRLPRPQCLSLRHGVSLSADEQAFHMAASRAFDRGRPPVR